MQTLVLTYFEVLNSNLNLVFFLNQFSSVHFYCIGFVASI